MKERSSALCLTKSPSHDTVLRRQGASYDKRDLDGSQIGVNTRCIQDEE